jgi:uncharacterized coiled-coil protein SlyX
MTESQAPTREELERRIVDLEVRAAFQTQTIELLDGVVREFAARVESLERAMIEIRGQIDLSGEPGADEPDA